MLRFRRLIGTIAATIALIVVRPVFAVESFQPSKDFEQAIDRLCEDDWTFESNMVETTSISDDGIDDFIQIFRPDCVLKGDEFAGRRHWCGTAGCATWVWVSKANGTWQLAMDGNFRGVRTTHGAETSFLEVVEHPGACELENRAPCLTTLIWDGCRLVPINDNYHERKTPLSVRSCEEKQE